MRRTDLISIPRAAELLGLERKAFKQILERREIRYCVPNKQKRVRVGDVLDYRDRRFIEPLVPEMFGVSVAMIAQITTNRAWSELPSPSSPLALNGATR